MKTSESIVNLAEAFVKFQEEITDPKLDADTDYVTKTGKKIKFKYASLPEILRTVRPVLSKCGLAITQENQVNGNEVWIVTRLFHKSGEWLEFEPLKMKATSALAQEIGSAITYGRRYNISSVLGLGAEADDDGEAATQGTEQDQEKPDDKKQERPNVNYVMAAGNDVKLLYPTFDDAQAHKTTQKYLLISGFNKTQCNYALSKKEYEPAWEYVKARLSEL